MISRNRNWSVSIVLPSKSRFCQLTAGHSLIPNFQLITIDQREIESKNKLTDLKFYFAKLSIYEQSTVSVQFIYQMLLYFHFRIEVANICVQSYDSSFNFVNDSEEIHLSSSIFCTFTTRCTWCCTYEDVVLTGLQKLSSIETLINDHADICLIQNEANEDKKLSFRWRRFYFRAKDRFLIKIDF